MRGVNSEMLVEQNHIARTLGVKPLIDIAAEVKRRVDFLMDALIANDRLCLVLGISGGIDSTTAGYLAQKAAENVRKLGHKATFIAIRLPYGEQRDEIDAQRALKFINPDLVLNINIKPASDAMLQALKQSGLTFDSKAEEDFILGNIKARQRMIAQYAVAGARSGMVIGTDHAAEALMGFFTKYGDGAADITPLAGLNKRQVRSVAAFCGANEALVYKVPTADLESLSPLKPDEMAFGVTYDEIDDFLEGKSINQRAQNIILRQYQVTAHKRALPARPD